jgi:glycosyltransferase involved in cell wall biosynthesis
LRIIGLVNEGLMAGVFRVAQEEIFHLNLIGIDSILHTNYMYPSLKPYFKMKTHLYAKLNVHHSLPVNYVGSFIRDFLGTAIEPKIPHNFQPDWIICHNLSPIYDAFRLAKNGSKTCVVIHNPTYPPSLFNIFLRLFGLQRRKNMEEIRRILQRVDLVLSTSLTLTPSLQQLGIPSKFLRLGCTPLAEVPAYRGNFILCASRISLGKRVDQVAKMIASVDKNYPVIFVGGTHATTREVICRIKKTGLKNYKLAFNVSDELLNKLYTQCRFFMAFSSGLPPLEAASQGAPIVCDNGSWANEYFKDRVHGYIYQNECELVSRCPKDIESLMLDERKAWKMGYEGWRLCRERYTWNNHVKTLIALLSGSDKTVFNSSRVGLL